MTATAIIEATLAEVAPHVVPAAFRGHLAEELASALADARRADVEVVRAALDELHSMSLDTSYGEAGEAQDRALAALSRLAGET